MIISAALFVSLALSAAATHAMMDDEIPVTAVYVDSEGKEVDADKAPDYTVPRAKCVFRSGGCTGGIKWTPKGNFFGCTRDPGAVLCHGNCERCENGTTPGYQCVVADEGDCKIPGGQPVYNCGFSAKYSCTTTVQPGQPVPENGCYCDLGSAISPPSAACYASDCAP